MQYSSSTPPTQSIVFTVKRASWIWKHPLPTSCTYQHPLHNTHQWAGRCGMLAVEVAIPHGLPVSRFQMGHHPARSTLKARSSSFHSSWLHMWLENIFPQLSEQQRLFLYRDVPFGWAHCILPSNVCTDIDLVGVKYYIRREDGLLYCRHLLL